MKQFLRGWKGWGIYKLQPTKKHYIEIEKNVV